MTEKKRPGDRYDRLKGGRRDRFSVRLTPGQAIAAMKGSGRFQTVADRVRGLITTALDGTPWPRLVDGSDDEGASVWIQFRVAPSMLADIHDYQQASGARDMSVAVRSLVTSALAREGER